MPENNKRLASTKSDRLSIDDLRTMKVLRTLTPKGQEYHCIFCRISISCLDTAIEVAAMLPGRQLTLHLHMWCHDAWRALLIRRLLPFGLTLKSPDIGVARRDGAEGVEPNQMT